MVQELLNGKLTVEEFRDQFYMLYVDTEATSPFFGLDSVFFDRIHEELDWTVAVPDAEDRSHGYRSNEEYVELVRQAHDEFLNGTLNCRWKPTVH